MDDNPIDLSPLDPAHNREDFEQRLRRIRTAAEPELSRCRARLTVWGILSAWRWPVAVSAAAVAVLALTFGTQSATEQRTTVQSDDLSDALGMPALMTGWIATDSMPATGDLLYPSEESR